MGAAAKYGPTALAVGTDGEAGEGIVDCAFGDCDGHVEEEQGEGELALVHPVLLLCSGACQLCAALCSAVDRAVFRSVPAGTSGFDCGVVFDWDGYYPEYVEGSGNAAVGAGCGALDCGGESVALGYPCGMDSFVDRGCDPQVLRLWHRYGLAAGVRLFFGWCGRQGVGRVGMAGEVDPAFGWIDGAVPATGFDA